MIEFLFTLPFTIFMFGIKWFGSFLVWVGIVVWVWSKRVDVWDSIVDLYEWFKSLLNRR